MIIQFLMFVWYDFAIYTEYFFRISLTFLYPCSIKKHETYRIESERDADTLINPQFTQFTLTQYHRSRQIIPFKFKMCKQIKEITTLDFKNTNRRPTDTTPGDEFFRQRGLITAPYA